MLVELYVRLLSYIVLVRVILKFGVFVVLVFCWGVVFVLGVGSFLWWGWGVYFCLVLWFGVVVFCCQCCSGLGSVVFHGFFALGLGLLLLYVLSNDLGWISLMVAVLFW